jgi:hypothetical protein
MLTRLFAFYDLHILRAAGGPRAGRLNFNNGGLRSSLNSGITPDRFQKLSLRG